MILTGKRFISLLLAACLTLPMLPALPGKARAAGEDFTLPTGQTYYFDLSAQVGYGGSINTDMPDWTLHYTPFTYVGTINAYSLDRSTSGNSGASTAAAASDRNLFVSDYVARLGGWSVWDGINLIFGKTFNTHYSLRSLSGGNADGQAGAPTNNEWDRILDKNASWIKNWSYRTWGQDTLEKNESYRVSRGGVDQRSAPGGRLTIAGGTGFRPVLEVLNPDTLGANGLKAVTLHLGNGSLAGQHSIQIVSAGTQFTAPGANGLTAPANRSFGAWNTAADGSGATYEAGANVPASVERLYAQWQPHPGSVYYFDLSGEADHIGTVNDALPDSSLHYVPFTYTGTINAYSLDSSANANMGAAAAATASKRRLFVADYVVSHSVSWHTLNTNGLIFGKPFDTGYTLRSLSGGSNATSGIVSPSANEWDQITGRQASWIKNQSVFSLMQDTHASNGLLRIARGSAAAFLPLELTMANTLSGWRPVLELSNTGTFGPGGWKDIALNLGNGSLNGENRIRILRSGDSFLAPGVTGLTPPADMTFDRWRQADAPHIDYAVGQAVPYTDGLELTAVWKFITTPEVVPSIVIDYSGERLTGFEDGVGYMIDGLDVYPDNGGLDAAGYMGKTISVIRKGNGTTRTDSAAQSVDVPARPVIPTAAAVNPTAIGGTGAITNVTSAMEYRLFDGVWSDVTGTDITNLGAGTYHIRMKATTGSFRSGEQFVALVEPGSEAMPNIGIDFGNEQLTGFVSDGSYTIEGAPAVPVNGRLNVAGSYMGTTIDIVKLGNGTTTVDSAEQSLPIPARPAAPAAAGVPPTTIGGTGMMTGVTPAMEYRSGGNWVAVTGTEITNLSPGSYSIRIKATASGFAGVEQAVQIAAFVPGAEALPAIAIDYATEELIGFATGGSYTVNGITAAVVDGKLSVTGSYMGTTLSIVRKGNGTSTVDSAVQNLVIPARPAAPSATGVDPTTIGGTGIIASVTSAMEYMPSDGNWTEISGTEVASLLPDMYYLRYKATGSGFKSAEQMILIAPLIPEAEAAPGIIIDYAGEHLTGFASGGSYTIGGEPILPIDGKLNVVGAYMGATIQIVRLGNGITTDDSAAQNLVVPARPDTPTAIGVDPAVSGGTGAITGLSAAMEIKSSTGSWTEATGVEMAGLAAGVYQVRVKATGSSFRSGEQTITLKMPIASVSQPAVNKQYINLGGRLLDPDGIDASKPSVTLDVQPKNGIAYVMLPASVLTNLAGKNAAFIIEIRTPYGSWRIPANLASLIPGLKELLARNHLEAGDVSFNITLTDKSGDKGMQAAFERGLPHGKALGALVDYRIEIANNRTGQSLGAADTFTQAITRLVPMPKNAAGMPPQWGAFHYHAATGKLEFVPAVSAQVAGGLITAIDSYSSGIYVVADNAVSFADVDKHWARSDVELAAAKGLAEGVGNGRYNPDKMVTRAEFAAMLVRALGRGATAIGSSMPYNDVGDDVWYADAIAEAGQLGLLQFANGTSFKPNQPLTRREMAVMLAAAIRLEQPEAVGATDSSNGSVPHGRLGGYRDIGGLSAEDLDSIDLMAKLQIMIGTDEDTFSPEGVTTRAQAATVFIRMLRRLGMID